MKYTVCTKTVMDTSYPGIIFDRQGISNHYHDFNDVVKPLWTAKKDTFKFERQLELIKKLGRNKQYDCILGLSGGLDSSYLLHTIVKKYELRPLVFHVDAGWNSELAVHNINALIDGMKLDLMTDVIDWNDMRNFQLAWFRAGVPHLDIPQDHAFVTTLYRFCQKYEIKVILNGGNIATESVVRPLKYIYWGSDMTHIRYIIQKFSPSELKQYQFTSAFSNKFIMPYIHGIKILKPLNYVNYTKVSAIEELSKTYGWRQYSEKHYESRFTKFFEGFWLLNRFSFDMRRVDYSSLILSGQLTRSEAIDKLRNPPYPSEESRSDFRYIASKLEISEDELDHYYRAEKKYYFDYPNSKSLLNMGEKVLSLLGITRRGGSY